MSVTQKLVTKVITDLYLLKGSGPDCIPIVVLKNSESQLSYILSELFNMCLEESCFSDCWKVSSEVLVFKNVGETCTAKNYRPVSLLSVVSKIFEKLLNNKLADHLEECGFFSDFQYGFRSAQSTADLWTVVSDRITRAFNRPGATRAVALDIPKAFDRLWLAGLFTNLSLMECWVRYLALFRFVSVIDGFEWFWMGSLIKSIQLILEFLKVPILVLHVFCYILMTFLMMLFVILLSMLMLISCLSLLDWIGVVTISPLLKLFSRKLEVLLEMLDKLQKRICKTAAPSLAASQEPLAYCRNVASLSLSIGITLVDVYLNWLNWFHLLILEGSLLVILVDFMIFLSLFLGVTGMSMSTVSFLAHLDSRILCL